eukprot:TRINITY_DN440_c0_g1_i10.p1 TRINITY_DN440_c0_g1~~TRINITY_DN440_c0_g1_i10.p1  ORF type:complete len:366 (+),score=74.12 TRINITY_DN440_c0_g1_i10:88-1185(+)
MTSISRLCLFSISVLILVLKCQASQSSGMYTFDLYSVPHMLNNNMGQWGYGLEYRFYLPIGTPAQYIPVAVDSGSPGLVVYSDICKDPECKGKVLFNQQESSSWVDLHKPVFYSYGAGKISGELGTEELSFSSSEKMTMLFSLIEKVDWTEPGFGAFNFSGICGLSLSQGMNNISVLQNAYDNGLIKYNMFGFGVSSDLSTPGELVLGGYDESYFTGDLQWHDVMQDQSYGILYMLNGTGVKVNGQFLKLPCAEFRNCSFLVDTGGGLFDIAAPGFPSLAVESDCSNVDQLPTFSIFIDNNEYEFTPADYILKIPNPNGSGTICVSTAIGADGPVVTADIAGWFFHKYYAVFDRQNQVVGFAPRN